MQQPDRAAETWTVLFVLAMAGNLILTLVLAAIWYVSPLGMGFSGMRGEPWRFDLYWLSWRYGIALLLAGQGAALYFALHDWRRRAIFVSGGMLALTLLLFALFLRQLG